MSSLFLKSPKTSEKERRARSQDDLDAADAARPGWCRKGLTPKCLSITADVDGFRCAGCHSLQHFLCSPLYASFCNKDGKLNASCRAFFDGTGQAPLCDPCAGRWAKLRKAPSISPDHSIFLSPPNNAVVEKVERLDQEAKGFYRHFNQAMEGLSSKVDQMKTAPAADDPASGRTYAAVAAQLRDEVTNGIKDTVKRAVVDASADLAFKDEMERTLVVDGLPPPGPDYAGELDQAKGLMASLGCDRQAVTGATRVGELNTGRPQKLVVTFSSPRARLPALTVGAQRLLRSPQHRANWPDKIYVSKARPPSERRELWLLRKRRDQLNQGLGPRENWFVDSKRLRLWRRSPRIPEAEGGVDRQAADVGFEEWKKDFLASQPPRPRQAFGPAAGTAAGAAAGGPRPARRDRPGGTAPPALGPPAGLAAPPTTAPQNQGN